MGKSAYLLRHKRVWFSRALYKTHIQETDKMPTRRRNAELKNLVCLKEFLFFFSLPSHEIFLNVP